MQDRDLQGFPEPFDGTVAIGGQQLVGDHAQVHQIRQRRAAEGLVAVGAGGEQPGLVVAIGEVRGHRGSAHANGAGAWRLPRGPLSSDRCPA